MQPYNDIGHNPNPESQIVTASVVMCINLIHAKKYFFMPNRRNMYNIKQSKLN